MLHLNIKFTKLDDLNRANNFKFLIKIAILWREKLYGTKEIDV